MPYVSRKGSVVKGNSKRTARNHRKKRGWKIPLDTLGICIKVTFLEQ